MAVPLLEKMPSKRRRRAGDFFAVLLLLAIVVGAGWLCWHQRHPHKILKLKSSPATQVVAQAVAQPTVQPKLKPILITPQSPADFPRTVRDVLEAQVALARRAISPGSIDAAIGSQTRAAIAAFQRSQKLFESGSLDTNTRPLLTLDAPLLTNYTVTTNDLARLQLLGKTWLAKSQQTALDYETELELVAEKAHSHPQLIRELNPEINWTNISAGTILKIPDVNYPEPDDKAAFVIIHLSEKYLEAFDADTN